MCGSKTITDISLVHLSLPPNLLSRLLQTRCKDRRPSLTSLLYASLCLQTLSLGFFILNVRIEDHHRHLSFPPISSSKSSLSSTPLYLQTFSHVFFQCDLRIQVHHCHSNPRFSLVLGVRFYLILGEVMRLCKTKFGIVSQCVLDETVNVKAKNKDVLANISPKINEKVGGKNLILNGPLPKVGDKLTIIFGTDVTHPNVGEDSTPSIAAVVASIYWPNVTKYIKSYSAQVGGKEIIQDMDKMVKHGVTSSANLQYHPLHSWL